MKLVKFPKKIVPQVKSTVTARLKAQMKRIRNVPRPRG